MSDTLELTSKVTQELKFDGDSTDRPQSTVNETLELDSPVVVQLKLVSKVDQDS